MTTDEIIRIEDAFQVPTYAKLPVALVHGEGSYVWDADGNRYLDFYGGHCVTILGHSPQAVVRSISEQAGRLLFYSNVVYSDVRARAAEALASMAPGRLGHVFFCNSGTEANETALKLARAFTGRREVIAMHAGFHGRTLGSLAVTADEKYRKPYASVLPPTTWLPFGELREVETALENNADFAALILEPIQSMAGVYEADPDFYRGLRDLCDRHGVVLIFDEVQTGVGRTGAFSISEYYGMAPDLITLAKSLGGGVPVGAVLVDEEIAASVRPGDQGTTFGGGMLAMAAVEATLRTIADEHLTQRATRIFDRIRRGVQPVAEDVRGRGCLIGIELASPAKPVIGALRTSGILTGSADHPNVIRLMPALTTTDDEVDAFVETLKQVLRPET